MAAEGTRKKVVYVVFIGAVIFGAVNFAGRGGGSETDLSAPTIEPLAAAAGGSLTAADTVVGGAYEWARDPFAYGRAAATGGGAEVRVTRFQLAAISEANGQLMAIINGKPLSRGETIEGWTVVRLTKTTAALELNGREVLLEMGN